MPARFSLAPRPSGERCPARLSYYRPLSGDSGDRDDEDALAKLDNAERPSGAERDFVAGLPVRNGGGEGWRIGWGAVLGTSLNLNMRLPFLSVGGRQHRGSVSW
jgi:hypothetical protein